MKIMLGDMELRDTEKPDTVQHGGGQMLAVNEFPSGNVSIQNFGSTYRDITWEGWFEGIDAMDRMYQIGNMRQKCKPILFVTEKYTCNVVIAEFNAEHRTNNYIPFSITLKRIIQAVSENQKDTVDKISEEIKENQKNIEVVKSEKYIVKKGDNLSRIAKSFYGNPNEYDKIYQANKDILTSGSHLIFEGQELTIP